KKRYCFNRKKPGQQIVADPAFWFKKATVLAKKSASSLFLFIGYVMYVQVFYLFAGPGCSAQKFEARFDARVVGEAAVVDHVAQHFPAVKTYQFTDHVFQGFAVQRVIGLRFHFLLFLWFPYFFSPETYRFLTFEETN